jgi:hypothetical protein
MALGPEVLKLIRDGGVVDEDELADRMSARGSRLLYGLTAVADIQEGSAAILHPLFGPARPVAPGAKDLDVFVLMPLTAELAPVFEDHIRKTAIDLNLTIRRADELFGSRNIMQDVWESICNSRLIIADCTGRNPNVFFQIGIAIVWARRCCS